MKKVLAAVAALTLATPAQALTWEEFWEPFNDDHHHHHVHYRGHRHGHDLALLGVQDFLL